MEETKLTKEDIIDVAVGVGIIFVTGFVAYKLGMDSGKKQYQKIMIKLARKNGEIWHIVDRDHRFTVTYL